MKLKKLTEKSKDLKDEGKGQLKKVPLLNNKLMQGAAKKQSM